MLPLHPEIKNRNTMITRKNNPINFGQTEAPPFPDKACKRFAPVITIDLVGV